MNANASTLIVPPCYLAMIAGAHAARIGDQEVELLDADIQPIQSASHCVGDQIAGKDYLGLVAFVRERNAV